MTTKVTGSASSTPTLKASTPPPPPPKPKPALPTQDGFTKAKPTQTSTTPARTGVQRTLPTTNAPTLTSQTITPANTAQTATPATPATPAAAATPVDPKGTPQDPKFKELSQQLTTAKETPARQKAANEMAAWTRDNIVDPKKLESYLGRTDVTPQEKQATLGQLALEVNRSEMVLGRAHVGGDGSWEHKGTNQGDFVNTYQQHAPNAKDDAWCTKFATHAYKRLGMDVDATTGGSTYPLLSGSRLTALTTAGTDNNKKQLIPTDQTLASDKTTGTVTTGKTFGELTSALNKAKPEERAQITADFMKKHGTPQPGDIIVRDPNNAVVGNSHTLMVERYDEKTGKLYTIEGNAGDKVQGFSYDLTDPAVAAQMGHLARFGPEQFKTTTNADGTPVSAADLLNNARAINKQLIEIAGNNGWVHSTDPNASAATLSSGGANPWTPGSTTSTR